MIIGLDEIDAICDYLKNVVININLSTVSTSIYLVY